MDKGLFVAMTGASQNMQALQARANNLANATTNGFKADLAQARAMPVFGDTYASRVYAMTERPATDFSPGVPELTGRDLDLAIRGEGWLAVQAGDGGEAYTRAGDLHIDAAGQLLTGSGLPVLGGGGPIVLPPAEKVQIGEDGTVSVRPLGATPLQLVVVDRLKLVNPDAAELRKSDDGLVRLASGALAEEDAAVRVEVGYLETSNVNTVHELTEIISLSRQYEMQVKMMSTLEQNAEASARILQIS